jgi:hypothetical protein
MDVQQLHVNSNADDESSANVEADWDRNLTLNHGNLDLRVVSDSEAELGLTATSSETGGWAISLLLHNPHWECFERDRTGHCKGNAWGQYTRFLQTYNMDFGGLLMGGSYTPPSGWQKLEHLAEMDRAALIFNTLAWIKEDHVGGEFERGRAFVVGRFRNIRTPSMKVIIAVAHYSHHVHHGHSAGAHHLKAVVERMKVDTTNVILMADTNQNLGSKNNHRLLEEIGAASQKTWAHEPTGTCCLDTAWVGGGMTFDRIASNFGRNLHTIRDRQYIGETDGYKKGPWWAYHATKPSGDVAAYHHPILAKLEM